MILLSLFLLTVTLLILVFILAGRALFRSPRAGILLFLIPPAAFGLYAFLGNPAVPHSPRISKGPLPENIRKIFQKLEKEAEETENKAQKSRKFEKIAALQWQLQDRQEAIENWQNALHASFSPKIAVQLAEAQNELKGYQDKQTQALYRKALETLPPSGQAENPPQWAKIAEMRLIQAEAENAKDTDIPRLSAPEPENKPQKIR